MSPEVHIFALDTQYFSCCLLFRTDQRLIMLYKIVNDLIEVDIVNELKPHSRHFRNNYSNSFRVPLARKTYLKYSF